MILTTHTRENHSGCPESSLLPVDFAILHIQPDALELTLKVKIYDAGKIKENTFYLKATKQKKKKNS